MVGAGGQGRDECPHCGGELFISVSATAVIVDGTEEDDDTEETA